MSASYTIIYNKSGEVFGVQELIIHADYSIRLIM
jgi:hypothetical protein